MIYLWSQLTTAHSVMQKKLLGGLKDFRDTPNGLGVIEHRMDLLYQGVLTGEKIPFGQRWVELCSTTPARLFGLQGRKGIIAPGADADIVIFNPKKGTCSWS
ncbi:MAG: hypothetical protein Ct9H90mP30_6600 [Actinomycetota bacterium]|nr:MAG: hypothetical protein Ct9H90mP30_6600 [Actinomycetota bacterium]